MRPVRMRSETKMPLALEQRVVFTAVRGFGSWSAFVEAQHVIHGAALSNPPKDNVANERLAFFITAGGKDPIVATVQESRTRLAEHKFPVVYREIADRGQEYLDGSTLQELIRWIDALDRQ